MKHYIDKLYLLLTVIAALQAFSGNAQEAEMIPVIIPEDSTAAAMNDTFRIRLHSAHAANSVKQYRSAVDLYETALEDLKHYNRYRLEQMETHAEETFHTSHKEDDITFLRETLNLRRIQNILLVILVAFIAFVLIALIVLLSYRLRSILQRAAHEESEAKIAWLEKERRELETKLREIETIKTRRELLAESLLVDYKNKLVNNIWEFINENPKLNGYKNELTNILNSGDSVYSDAAYSVNQNSNIHEVHPQLFSKLQEKAGNRLTNLDLEYCRMIYLKMTSKEMAEILQVDPKTIRVTKYRLKQKLGLDKNVNLGGFIEGIG